MTDKNVCPANRFTFHFKGDPMSRNRHILWKKQRQFLDACMEGKATVSKSMEKLGINQKMLSLWLSRPKFLTHYRRVTRFLEQVKELDLIIGARHGANLLTEQQLKKTVRSQVRTELIKLVNQLPAKAAKPKRPPLRNRAHPDHSPQEVLRLLDVCEGKAPSD
jgi:hypothetical protein